MSSSNNRETWFNCLAVSGAIKSLLFVSLLTGLLTGCAGNGEATRKARVQTLIKQLANESTDRRNAIYEELRGSQVRKRDIPTLINVIERNENPEVTVLLQSLVSFMNESWRLPNGEWTSDIGESSKAYEEEFGKLGCFVVLSEYPGYSPKPDLILDIFDYPAETKKVERIIDLIQILEPEALALPTDWDDIEFVETLTNLEELHVGDNKVETDRED